MQQWILHALTVNGLRYLSTDHAAATAAITTIDTAIEAVSDERSKLGANTKSFRPYN